jgi:hypothetical protein
VERRGAAWRGVRIAHGTGGGWALGGPRGMREASERRLLRPHPPARRPDSLAGESASQQKETLFPARGEQKETLFPTKAE